jgi:predicted nucleic acid-binding protein
MPLFYVDASALVKVTASEQEADDLSAYLEGAEIASSELVLAEVPRALRRKTVTTPGFPLEEALERASALIDSLGLRPVDDALLIGAGMLAEPALRSLDAIHVATAIHLYPIDAFVTYDKRQAAVARLAGLRTVAPGMDTVN